MDSKYSPYIDSLYQQRDGMLAMLIEWSNINTHSNNMAGLNKMQQTLLTNFDILGGNAVCHALPPRTSTSLEGVPLSLPVGSLVSIKKREQAPIQLLLSGHMDTVFASDSSFLKAFPDGNKRLKGPGVADMKGGLIVLFHALQLLESTPFAREIGWQVVVTPDEEVGSVASAGYLAQEANRYDAALVFEPSFPDGAFVSARKGSANFTLIVRGREAHVGRDYFRGRSAITALANVIEKLSLLTNEETGVIVNVGVIQGGSALNVVPGLASCRFNVRTDTKRQLEALLKEVKQILSACTEQYEVQFDLHADSTRLPKEFDSQTQDLFESFRECASALSLPFEVRPTGGVCDGNIFAAAGLPTIDTLGVVGGNLHTTDEYMLVDSLPERASLTALFLLKIANHELKLPMRAA